MDTRRLIAAGVVAAGLATGFTACGDSTEDNVEKQIDEAQKQIDEDLGEIDEGMEKQQKELEEELEKVGTAPKGE